MEEILQMFNAIQPITPELELHLSRVVKRKEISKKALLLQEGEVCQHIYFVKKGLLRAFYRADDNSEITIWLLKDLDVLISVQSFYKQTPSLEFIEALEDCQLYYMSFHDLQSIYLHYPEFNFIGRVITEKYNLLLAEYNYFTKIKPTHYRYRYLLENYPELVGRVSNRDIASFLGISQAHLSVIKGKK